MKKLLIPLLLMVIVLSGCSNTDVDTDVDTDVNTDVNTDIDIVDDNVFDVTTLPYYSFLDDSNPVITIKVKDIGEMKIQLFPDVAQNTVNNMILYILDDDYTDTTFHRVIEDFMIQGGIINDTTCPIKGEFPSNGVPNNLGHYRGVISMARTNMENSATSQFFIVHADSFYLDINYASFGGLVSGFNVLDSIAWSPVGSGNIPVNDIVIESITVELNGYVPAAVVCTYY